MIEQDDGSFTWDYRIVNNKSENGGDDWYCLREVTYKGGKPTGHGDPCLGSEDMDSMRKLWDWMSEALALPPLQEEDFKNTAQQGETA